MSVVCLTGLFFSLRYITQTLSTIDLQVGTQLTDPLHKILPPAVDLSNIIFFLTYSSVFIVILDVIIRSPLQLLRLGFAIAIMKFLRSFTMVFFPLEPPEGIIALKDPIVNFLTPNHIVALRDLFFSGHCATMMILFYIAVHPMVKSWMRIMIFVVPFLILWQRVHYTIDVIAGMAIGAGIYFLLKRYVKMSPEFEENFS